MFYIYAIYNKKHGKIYIGQSHDPVEREKLHNNHTFKHSYTSRFDGDWKLIYVETCTTRKSAIKREKQLKSYRGREYIKNFIPR